MASHGGNYDPNAPVQRPQVPAYGSSSSTTYTTGSPALSSPVPSYPHQSPVVVVPPSSYVYQGHHTTSAQPITHYQQHTMAQQPYYQQSPMNAGGATGGYVHNEPVEKTAVVRETEIYQQQAAPYNTVTGVGYQESPYLVSTQAHLQEAEVIDDDIPQKEIATHLKSSWHIFSSQPDYRWIHTHHYKKPGLVFQDQSNQRHRDYAGRVSHKPLIDRYLHHDNGYLRKLIVQTTDEVFEAKSNVTWLRTYVRKQAPIRIRLATWVIDYGNDQEANSWGNWWIMVLRALPASIAMTLSFWDLSISGEQKYNGWYAPVPYRFHGNAKTWSNYLENRIDAPLPVRRLNEYCLQKPRRLCALRNPHDSQLHGLDIVDVDKWEAEAGSNQNLSYLFVAYSTEHFNHDSNDDMRALHIIAESACRQAALPAYWIACSCMGTKEEVESDVYRISDVLRGAQKLVIAVGHSSTRSHAGNPNTDTLLRQWGNRMWTFPEVLLSPGEDIIVYTRDGDLSNPLKLTKNQFAGRVWAHSDAETAGQLVDHYIGSLGLSRLELSILLLKCLYKRNTTQYLDGDQAYALMGLLRLRPKVDKTDSDFQAFARLSLANDSDQLLERYLCTLPLTADQKWHNMDDAYQSALWDITPTCQIAAICDDDTVIVDGAYGASIRWKSFYRINYSRNLSWRRLFASFCLQYNAVNLIIACAVLGTAGAGPYTNSAAIIVGLIFLGIFFYFWLNTPRLVRLLLGGKFTDVQAALFGIEGHLNAATIERTLFGGCFGRLTWSVNGSPLSRSRINIHGERVAVDPATDPEVRRKIEAAKHAQLGEMRIFTLVDTYNMELTLFESVRPPTCIFLCAAEGGMRRAIACSYDWTTQTMYRETVLRMPTPMLNKMDRVQRFRLGIQRPNMPVRPVTGTVV